ncbi:ATP-binding cassette domain-containing protein [Pseudohalocynthiibacter aestuariivivens]|uniref:ATP-binding cassette domain-containing protein n=1 Tax=Roseovarius pelagicus TaxID=2980108 RepID=A0ABY6DCP2_9RHOB|nr:MULTISPECIES: oligopeptide/dipeptide ABC transporter ATP-binding protein [Rhodobacterales]QIE45096.1 ATP-binding cassette domain-containing protein [Pseudohalocynthiibacter aestuariivivens]UXX82968.1 ATP-binding cassette domain-containing protein [Roseovarius pelagicus]
MSDPIVETRGIEVRFALPTHFLSREKPVLHALSGVDVQIMPGETFCVVGESGCGKTTLGRAIIGLNSPSAGEVYFNGKRIDQMEEAERKPIRRDMQMVFQNPYASLNPRRNVFETLAEPIRHLMPEKSETEVRAQVEEVLAATGCDPSWQRKLPHEFSGGQRQRIAIARALVTNPAFIVADEPISALDVSIQAQILNLLTNLQAERGLTYLFITHDLSVVKHFGTRVAVMYLGQVMELADAETIFADPKHPYTRLLLDAIPKLEGGSFERPRQPGELPDPVNPPPGCPFAPRCPIAADLCRSERPKLRVIPGSTTQAACHFAE